VTSAPSEVSMVAFGQYSEEWLQGRPDLAVRTVELYRWLLRRLICTRSTTMVPPSGITASVSNRQMSGTWPRRPSGCSRTCVRYHG
jgi:hypothetical protein